MHPNTVNIFQLCLSSASWADVPQFVAFLVPYPPPSVYMFFPAVAPPSVDAASTSVRPPTSVDTEDMQRTDQVERTFEITFFC